MTQAITGVYPTSHSEATVMMTWPSIGASSFGRTLGGLYSIRTGFGNILTIGNLIALLSIPQALLLFALNILPWSCRRYRITNRRIVVEKGVKGAVDKEVSLDNFDAVSVEVLPGQEWYPCGNLIFTKNKVETFRLDGVRHPESFRQACLKTQRGFAGVKKAVGK